MLYAASLPKIAVMLGVFQKASEGKLVIDGETRGQLQRMIRRSSNTDATALMHKVGLDYVSCSPFRVPIARLAAAQSALREKGVSAK